VERSSCRLAAQRSARLFGRAHQRVRVVRMLGFLADDTLKRSLHGFQELHTIKRILNLTAAHGCAYLKYADMAVCSALKSSSSGPIFSSGMPSAAIAPASSVAIRLEATIDSPVELTY
jgi:hypothetical protein